MKKLLSSIFFALIFSCSLSLAQVKILTIGDSTMADYDVEKNSGEKEKRGWAQMLPVFLNDNVSLTNAAKNGRSSKSFYHEFWENLRETLKPGDYVFIQFGHNDEKANGQDTADGERGTAAWGQYQEYLTRYITESRERGAIPILLTPVVRRLFDTGNNITDTGLHNLTEFAKNDSLMNYPMAMRTLAKEMNVPLVDMTILTEKLVKDYGAEKSKEVIYALDDNTHLKAMGGILFSKLAVEDLIRQGILTDYLSLSSGLQIKPSAIDFGIQFTGETTYKSLSVIGLDLEPQDGYITISVQEPFCIFNPNEKEGWVQTTPVSYSNGNINTQVPICFKPTSSGEYKQTALVTINGKETKAIELTGRCKSTKGGKRVSATCYPASYFAASMDKNLKISSSTSGLSKEVVDKKYLFTALGGWLAGDIDVNANRYLEFEVAPSKGVLYIDTININIGAIGGKNMYFTALGSVNKDFSEVKTFAVMENLKDGKITDYVFTDVIEVPKGETYYIRIYPWNRSAATDNFLWVRDVSFKGLFFKK